MKARAVWSVAAVSLFVVALPAVAGAHVRIGTLAVDARVRVISTGSSALAVSVSQRDRALHLTVRGDHRVEVLGYLGEPELRVDRRGVAVNLASPTAAAAGLVPKGEGESVHARWLLERGVRTAVWRDPRLQQRLPAGVSRARWVVPVVVDGRSARIVGELRRAPPPSLWRWLAVVLGALSAGGVAALGRSPRRRRMTCAALGAVAVGAGIVVAAGFAFEAGATGMRVATVYELMLAVGGAGFAVWGPPEVRLVAAGWLGLLGLISGLACGQIFLYGAVLSALPATLTRAAAAVAIGSGSASLLAGALYLSLANVTSSPARRRRTASPLDR